MRQWGHDRVGDEVETYCVQRVNVSGRGVCLILYQRVFRDGELLMNRVRRVMPRHRVGQGCPPRAMARRNARPHARRRRASHRRARGPSSSDDPSDPAPAWGWRPCDLSRERAL